MNYAQDMVAKKYATAFVAVFYESLSVPIVQQCAHLATYMREHADILFFLQLSALSNDEKRTGLRSLIQHYELPECLLRLVDVLLEHKRTFLLAAILEDLCDLYSARQQIMSFTITSSHPLSESAVKSIQKFLAYATGNTILYTCVVDPALIAGIRMANTILFWEHSVARQLRMAHNALVK